MFRSLGTILIIWYLSTLFTGSFKALDSAVSATLSTLEVVANVSKAELVR